MLILNILGLGLWLVIVLSLLRFIAKNLNVLVAIGVFVAGYLALFNTLGTMFGYGLTVWGGLIGLGVLGTALTPPFGRSRRATLRLRDQWRADSEGARLAAEADRLASQDAFHKAYCARYDAEQQARLDAEADFNWMDKLRNG